MLSKLLSITAVIGLTVTATIAQDTAPYFPNNWTWKNASIYPPLFDSTGAWAKAPTNTSLVQEWMKLVNWTGVPNATINKLDANGNLIDPYANAANPYCDWSFDGVCTRPADVVNCPQKGVWGLTFDDGPTAAGAALYDYLASIKQKASLFYIGLMVAQYPQNAKRACDDGHHISIHTWSHQVLTTLTNIEIVAELKYTEMIIKEVCGVTPRYFRPPTGDIDDRVRYIAAQLGYTPIMWDLDTNDWTNGEPGGVTAAQEDANFTIWTSAAQLANDTHGHITLQHELTNFTVNEAIKNIPILKKVYNVMPVASCIGETHPYLENIVYPVIQPNGSVAVPANATNSTTSSIPPVAPTTANVGSASAAVAAESIVPTASSAAYSVGSSADRSVVVSAALGVVVGVIALLANTL
ncbi:hypothetical protein BC938DRAFT_481543 [Jimgerdemannia flammicorona]|uniref:NodB homology domain-containing protein n=1 Tax=Jimgerdemannia flammicorona TaxID=994334 RepID=A0A433QFZ9_9FUNG|nr:hypothetical protein BC938DRAFT_481543 [Jimgerdemannia flammicorona]